MQSELSEDQILAAGIIAIGVGQGGPQSVKYGDCVGLLDGTVKEYTAGGAGGSGVDACYVAETAHSIVVAFRGTLMPTFQGDVTFDVNALLDCFNNLRAEPISTAEFPGKVHEGFYTSVKNLLTTGFVQDVQARQQAENKALVVTGYSKGAALAPLGSWLLQQNGITIDELHFYEPPRCGNGDFATAFNQAFPGALRYEYQDDIFPHLPPTTAEFALLDKGSLLSILLRAIYSDYETWNYTSVGTLQFAQWNTNEFTGDFDGLQAMRMKHLADAFKKSITLPLKEHIPDGHLFAAVKQFVGQNCKCQNCPPS